MTQKLKYFQRYESYIYTLKVKINTDFKNLLSWKWSVNVLSENKNIFLFWKQLILLTEVL